MTINSISIETRIKELALSIADLLPGTAIEVLKSEKIAYIGEGKERKSLFLKDKTKIIQIYIVIQKISEYKIQVFFKVQFEGIAKVRGYLRKQQRELVNKGVDLEF